MVIGFPDGTRAVILDSDALPEIIALLDNSNLDLCRGATKVLNELTQHGEFSCFFMCLADMTQYVEDSQAWFFYEGLPKVVGLLDHSNGNICRDALRILTHLARHSELSWLFTSR